MRGMNTLLEYIFPLKYDRVGDICDEFNNICLECNNGISQWLDANFDKSDEITRLKSDICLFDINSIYYIRSGQKVVFCFNIGDRTTRLSIQYLNIRTYKLYRKVDSLSYIINYHN